VDWWIDANNFITLVIMQRSINQSIKFITSVAHCRLDFTINSRIAYMFKNTSAILNVDTTEITIVDETRECLSKQMMLTKFWSVSL